MEHPEDLWPNREYHQQVEKLRAMIGQPLYIVEINSTEINAGVHFPSHPLRLLAVIDFPEPDPYKQLCPHLLVLEDGRGLNLGRIARISSDRAYTPEPEKVLFTNREFVQNVLFAPRTLSRESAAAATRAVLSRMFGDTPGKFLEAHAEPRSKRDKLDALPQSNQKS